MKDQLDRDEVVNALSDLFGVDGALLRRASFAKASMPTSEVITKEIDKANALAIDLIGGHGELVTAVEFGPDGATVHFAGGEPAHISFAEAA